MHLMLKKPVNRLHNIYPSLALLLSNSVLHFQFLIKAEVHPKRIIYHPVQHTCVSYSMLFFLRCIYLFIPQFLFRLPREVGVPMKRETWLTSGYGASRVPKIAEIGLGYIRRLRSQLLVCVQAPWRAESYSGYFRNAWRTIAGRQLCSPLHRNAFPRGSLKRN